MLKPNTTYTVFFKYESTCNNMPRLQIIQGNSLEYISDPTNSVSLTNNIYRCVIKTSSSFEGKKVGAQVIYFHNSQPKKVGDTVILYKNMLFLEGDYSNLQIEELPNYFEGIKSSFEDGVVDVEVTGKNLFNFEGVDILSSTGVTYTQTGNEFEVTSNSNSPMYARIGIKYPANLFAGKTITLSCKATKTINNTSPTTQIYYRDENDKAIYIGFWNRQITHTFPKKILTNFVELNLYPNNTNVAGIVNTINVSEIMAEEVSSKTSYEPYYKKKISFNIEEPLRSLPNGVCDEIRNNNGQWELVRRVGKVVLDGSEKGIWLNNIRDGRTQFVLQNTLLTNPSLSIYQNGNAWCDTLPVIPNDNPIRAIWVYEKNNIVIQLPVEIADTVDKLRAWLSQNPTTVYYELQTPIIIPIEPMEFDVKPLATMTINSEIAPISNHKVILNRAGQIEQGIELIANLKSRINELENIYDSNLITTQYRIDNLKLNYELEREED